MKGRERKQRRERNRYFYNCMRKSAMKKYMEESKKRKENKEQQEKTEG